MACHRQTNHGRSTLVPPVFHLPGPGEGGAVVKNLGFSNPWRAGGPHLQAENELPQPQDFFEFGFTNTKPCCISVSW